MKPFRFPLESLRVLRKQREHDAQLRYARALASCDTAAEQLQAAVAALTAGWEALVAELAGGTTAAKILGTRTWCTVLEIRRNERRAALDEARRAAESAFQQMVAAARDREALDRFFDRSRRAHELTARREEQKHFDEMAVQLGESPGALLLKLN
jgi:flagellar export protein FliJ